MAERIEIPEEDARILFGEEEVSVEEETQIKEEEVVEQEDEQGIGQEEEVEEVPAIEQVIVENEVVKQEEVTAPEKKIVKEKVKIPFVNEKQRILYNMQASEEGVDEATFNLLYNKKYENLSPEMAVEMSIRIDPNNDGLPERVIKNLLNKKLNQLSEDLDLDIPEDLDVYNKLLEREAKIVTSQFDLKRNELIQKFSSDVEIESEYEVDEEPTLSEAEIEEQRNVAIARELQQIDPYVLDGTFKIKHSSGNIISVPVGDKRAIASAAANPMQFLMDSFVKDGKPDYAKFTRFITYAQNPEAFETTMINFGKELGKDNFAKEIKNTKEVKPRAIKSNVADVSPNDDPQGFLAAMEAELAKRKR